MPLMIALARQKLKQSPESKPSFLYLHTKGCHSVNRDFCPPPSWNGRVSPNENRSDRYDDLLAWIDHLWPWFNSAIPDDAVVVVTSDHGELLGEDDLFGHDFDYPLLHKVPLWIRGAKRNWPASNVAHTDVMNCLLTKVDAPSEPCDIDTATKDEQNRPAKVAEEKLPALGYK